MRKVTVQLEPEHVRMLDDLASDDGPCTTRSESVRHVVEAFDGNRDRSRSRDEERTHDDTDALRRELRSKEARITELRNHITTRDRTQRKLGSLTEECRDRQHVTNAPFFVRWYHWLQEANERVETEPLRPRPEESGTRERTRLSSRR